MSGVFNRPECCNQPCECPVCLENKPLMRLNCNHYVCLEDIQHIININPRRLQRCPICRVLINNYGCNGNIINIENNQPPQPNIIPYEEGQTDGEETDNETNLNVVTDDEGYETDELYGGKRKRKRKRKTHCARKYKKNITKRRNYTNKKKKINKKRKTKRRTSF